jgi:methionyl-tRNA formyltransferase
MKLAVLGRTHWLLGAARRLRDAGHDIRLVATAEAAPEYRAGVEDFRAFAADSGATFALDEVPQTDAQLAVSVNWPRLIGRDVLDAFPGGVVNAHAGDLPRYRGNAAPNWAIINGEDRIVLTLHLMDEGLDSGPVLAKTPYPLGPRTTIRDVYSWLDEAIPSSFVEVVRGLGDGTVAPQPQPDDPTLALRVPRRRPEDSELRWQHTAVELDRMVRASSEPFAGAFTTLEGRRLTIWRARPEPWVDGGVVGSRVDRCGEVGIATADGVLVLEDVELEGRRGSPTDVLQEGWQRVG